MSIKFDPEVMRRKYGYGDAYISPARSRVSAPTGKFLLGTFFGPLGWLWHMARQNRCNDTAWVYGSAWLADIFERIGGSLQIEGLENLASLKEPAVFVANHMSTLETFILPGLIRPYCPVTFVVKKSLTEMPVFGPIMRSRDPVAVKRTNPREDLAIVLEEGVKRLKNGISIIVFPQHSRMLAFDREQFNSIGIKLARRANVPVVPLALKTDAWGNGRKIKELGRVRPELPAHFKFSRPVHITGSGRAEHEAICDFISHTVGEWQRAEGVNHG